MGHYTTVSENGDVCQLKLHKNVCPGLYGKVNKKIILFP
jgi:hypothetical protein